MNRLHKTNLYKFYKVTDGRRTLTHDKSSHGLWPGELKIKQRIPVIPMSKCKRNKIQQTLKNADPSCLQWKLAEILKIFLSETTKPIGL
jgi:hypothetical protein